MLINQKVNPVHLTNKDFLSKSWRWNRLIDNMFFFSEGFHMSAPPWAKNYRDYVQIKQQMAWELRLKKGKIAKNRFQELGEK